jgi:hypothetical protein
MIDTVKKAEAILKQNIEAWGKERKKFQADIEEIIFLLKAGAEIIRWNFDQEDGTFTHEVKYRDFIFICSSIEQI